MAKRIEEPGEMFVKTIAACVSKDINITKKIQVAIPGGVKDLQTTPMFFIDGVKMSLILSAEHYPGPTDVFLENFGDEVQTVSGILMNTGSGQQISFGRKTLFPAIKAPGAKACGIGRIDFSEDSGQMLEITLTLHTKENASNDGWIRSKIEPDNKDQENSLVKAIMEDGDTADFTLRCETKEFRVHKNVLCARSPVFRAAILSDIEEGREGVMLMDLDEKTLASVIHFVYLSELKMSDDQDIQMLVLAADLYDLTGLRDLLLSKLDKEGFRGETTADLLISAYRHGAKNLRELAFEKIRADRSLCKEEGFVGKMKKADPLIMIDLFNNL